MIETQLLEFRMLERLVLSGVILVVAFVVMVGFWRTVQKVDLSHGSKLGVAGSFTLSTPVFVLLGIVGYAWVSLSHPITVTRTDLETGNAIRTALMASQEGVPPALREVLDGILTDDATAQAITSDALPPDNRFAEIARVQSALWAINCVTADRTPSSVVANDLIAAKLDLMEPVWDRAAWGPFADFALWARTADGSSVAQPQDAPRVLFDEVHPRC